MGGYGPLKIAMLYGDVFTCVYALSPGLLAFVKEFEPDSDFYKQLGAIKSKDALDKTYYPGPLLNAPERGRLTQTNRHSI